MALLLDTHVWIWSVLEPERLSPRMLRDLGKQETWLSPVSVWEAMLLNRRGKLELPETPTAWMRRALAESRVQEAPLTHEIAMESECVDLPRGDPADRFLVATAKVLGLVLVTADRKILAAKACATLGAGA